MPQVPKPEVRARIERAALDSFARDGYAGTTIAGVAAAAGTATANVYRYHRSKRELFDTVVPVDLPARHDALLDARIGALTDGSPTGAETSALLEFWSTHRLAVVVLLDRAERSPHAEYPARFVQRLVDHAVAASDAPPSADRLVLLDVVFDNTRRAIARLLAHTDDRARITALIDGFWSYQLPGLAGLARWAGPAG